VPQSYYGTIQVTAPGVFNSPLNYTIVLDVLPSNTPPLPILQPAGLVFVSQIGGNPDPQTVVVNSTSGTSVNYAATVSTTDGNNWLSVTPVTGISSNNPTFADATVSVSPGALASGVYQGTVTFQYPAAAIRSVNVTLIIEPPPTPPFTCVATEIAPTLIDLMGNFSVITGRPTPVSVTLLDNCGNPVSNAQVTGVLSDGDAPLVFSLVNPNTGLYSATWSPVNASQSVTLTVTATSTLYSPAATVTGTVLPGSAPQLTPGGTLQLYNEQVGNAIPPGSILEIYGSNLSSAPALASAIPLPTTLGGTSVTIGGYPAPLFYVAPGKSMPNCPPNLRLATAIRLS
jgi:hypothetical protein